MKHLRFSLVGLALVFGANAQAVLIDFEEFEWAQSSGQRFTPHHPGSTILGISWGGEITYTIDRLGVDNMTHDGRFDFMDTSDWDPFPASWGTTCLDPFYNTEETYFRMRFATPITSFSIEAGDYGADDDTLRIFAYEGDDYDTAKVAESSAAYSGNIALGEIVVGSVSSNTPFKSVYFAGTSVSNFNSLYFDNVRVTPVPEPASMLALAGALALLRRRAR